MDIFTESSGINGSLLYNLLSFLLSFAMVYFFTLSLVGMYNQVIDGKKTYLDLMIEATVLMAVVTGIAMFLL
ncbi:MAG: hypothetical protein COB83_05070 [Gammaproteobacteria bacterium]|nr:MAG: hypothetical protein COB83_05070 [Gammaproteobacteria bacterium]